MPLFLEFMPNTFIDKVFNITKELDIHFSCLHLTDQSKSALFDFIIENNYYDLNFNMVKTVVLYKSVVEEESLILRHLTTINAMDFKPLWLYIQMNLPEYIEKVFFTIEENTDESEEIVIYLLEEGSPLSSETKEAIIEKEKVLITDIRSVPESLWKVAVAKNKMKCSWDNVLCVYNRFKVIDTELACFLNISKNYTLLSKAKMTDGIFENDIYISFSKDIICSTKITSDTFSEIYKSLPCSYDNFLCEELTLERLKDVIKYKIFNFTKSIYDCIRANHKSVLELFVSENIERFHLMMSELEVDTEDMLSFIDYRDIPSSVKIDLIMQFDGIILCNSTKYADSLCNVIFASKKSIELLPQLIKDILSQNISQDSKIQLLLNQKNYHNFDNMMNYLDLVGDPYSRMMKLRTRTNVGSTKLNLELFEMLKTNGLISSFDIVEHRKIRVVGKYP